MKALLVPALPVAVVVAGVTALAQDGRRTICARYEPDTVRIAGTLARHMYFGAPGYGEDSKRDEKEVGFYLDLATPLCMQPAATTSTWPGGASAGFNSCSTRMATHACGRISARR